MNGESAMARSRLHYWVSPLLVLSLAIGGIAAWRALRATGEVPISTAEPRQARIEPAAPGRDADVKLPEDLTTVVIELKECGSCTSSLVQVRADGTVLVVPPGSDKRCWGRLSALEVQDLLRSIVHDSKFFGIQTDRSYMASELERPSPSPPSGELRVQADGNNHAVEFGRAGNPATEEGQRLNAILTRVWVAAAQGLLQRLNSWPKDEVDIYERPEADGAQGRKASAETVGWVSTQKDGLSRLGVQVHWNSAAKRYERLP
jgi:hypothetical protein